MVVKAKINLTGGRKIRKANIYKKEKPKTPKKETTNENSNFHVIPAEDVKVTTDEDGNTVVKIFMFGGEPTGLVTANVGVGVTDMSQFIKQFSTLLATHPVAAKDFLQRVNLRFRKNNTIRTLYQLTESDKTELVSLIISFCTKATDSGQPIKIKDFNVVLTDLKKSGKTLAEALISVLDSTFTELKSHLM